MSARFASSCARVARGGRWGFLTLGFEASAFWETGSHAGEAIEAGQSVRASSSPVIHATYALLQLRKPFEDVRDRKGVLEIRVGRVCCKRFRQGDLSTRRAITTFFFGAANPEPAASSHYVIRYRQKPAHISTLIMSRDLFQPS